VRAHWPPRALGIGPPLNLALLSATTRPLARRSWWLPPVVGLTTALAMMAADHALFGGVTMRATPGLNEHPPIGNRILVAIIGSLGEGLVFRVGVATAVAWLAYVLSRRVIADAVRVAQWVGTIVAALAVGWMHVGQNTQPDVWRLVTLNGIGHTVYGWLYWTRGFEISFLTHAVVTSILYIAWPALRPVLST
jgi:hypothetical protein